jgi:hypothetical protein
MNNHNQPSDDARRRMFDKILRLLLHRRGRPDADAIADDIIKHPQIQEILKLRGDEDDDTEEK